MTEVTKITDGAGVQHAVRDDNAVHRTGNESVSGIKTFAQSPLVPTIQSTDDNSQKTASTGWVTAKISAWWDAIKSTVTFTKSQVGLGNVDNTSDVDKPVSTATQAALDLKANDNAVVKLTGDQTVAGNKTFSGTLAANAVVGSAFAIAGMPKAPAIDTTITTSGIIEFGQGVLAAPFSCWVVVGRKALADTQMSVIVTKGLNDGNWSNRIFQTQIPVPSGELCYITSPVPANANVYVFGDNLTASGLAVAQRYFKCHA